MTCIVGVKGNNNRSTIIADIRLTSSKPNPQHDS